MDNPTADDIITLATSCGYKQRRATTSYTLFFVEMQQPPHYGMPPVLINVFYTTRSIMTHLNHPSSSSGGAAAGRSNNELWRSNAYDNIHDLKEFFLNPRIHTGKGYRNANKAVRGCVKCGELRRRTDFSHNQWLKGPDLNKCKDCIGGSGRTSASSSSSSGGVDGLSKSLGHLNLNNERQRQQRSITPPTVPSSSSSSTTTLTENLLKAHDNNNNNTSTTNKPTSSTMERRQFNCPDCPRHGRGPHIFFKKVPTLKPIVKCPRCKKAARGRCHRIHPVPRDKVKGYGLFKCRRCGDTWGSRRAVENVGQECVTCRMEGVEGVMTMPFRLEVWKPKSMMMNGGNGGGQKMRKVPKEPIGEDTMDQRGYNDDDRRRNVSAGANSLVRRRGPPSSYDIRARDDDDLPAIFERGGGGGPPAPSPVKKSRVPAGYEHRCTGCATGACRNRKVPKSEVHDVSDGDTVSTSASVVTDSSVDKTDYYDRDEDFSGFELDYAGDDWIGSD